jgi:excinuclease ABC subunit C
MGPAGTVIQVFLVRGGRVVDRIELSGATGLGVMSSEGEVLATAISQFYENTKAPPEVHLPSDVDEREALEAWLSDRAGRRVRIVVPRRGEKKGLLELAARNAGLAYDARFNAETLANYQALETLRDVLALSTLPRRIDCFDISTIQGSETVASMVVCEDGRMKKADYRKFKIKDEGRGTKDDRRLTNGERFQDDFAAMRQVVQRRYRRVLEDGGPFPDLIVIDGGKGQLEAAYEALESLGLANLVAIGLAKKEELIFTRDHAEPIGLAADDPALLLLQRIRDEAHRFAITFHRASRAKRTLTSELDAVPGLGPRRRRLLLQKFGSLAGVRRASREDLEAIVGARVAEAVLRHFGS